MTQDEFDSLRIGDIIQATGSDGSMWVITGEKCYNHYVTGPTDYQSYYDILFVFGPERSRMPISTASVPHVWTKISS